MGSILPTVLKMGRFAHQVLLLVCCVTIIGCNAGILQDFFGQRARFGRGLNPFRVLGNKVTVLKNIFRPNAVPSAPVRPFRPRPAAPPTTTTEAIEIDFKPCKWVPVTTVDPKDGLLETTTVKPIECTECRNFTTQACTPKTFEVCNWIWTEKTEQVNEDECHTVKERACHFRRQIQGGPDQVPVYEPIRFASLKPLNGVARRARNVDQGQDIPSDAPAPVPAVVTDVVEDQGQLKVCREWKDETGGIKQECHPVTDLDCQEAREPKQNCEIVQKIQEQVCTDTIFIEPTTKTHQECQIPDSEEQECIWPERTEFDDLSCQPPEPEPAEGPELDLRQAPAPETSYGVPAPVPAEPEPVPAELNLRTLE